MFQGTWEAVSLHEWPAQAAEGAPVGAAAGDRGGDVPLRGAGGVYEGRLRLDPTRRPREIVSIPTSGKHRGKVAPGIYEING